MEYNNGDNSVLYSYINQSGQYRYYDRSVDRSVDNRNDKKTLIKQNSLNRTLQYDTEMQQQNYSTKIIKNQSDRYTNNSRIMNINSYGNHIMKGSGSGDMSLSYDKYNSGQVVVVVDA